MNRVADLVRFGDQPFRLPGSVECIAESPDGTLIAAGSGFGDALMVWERATGRVVARATQAAGAAGFVGNDRIWFAYGQLLRWDFRQSEPEKIPGDLGIPMAVSPQGRWIAVSGRPSEEGDVAILDAARATQIRRIPGQGKPVRSLSFSFDERLLAVGYEDTASIVDLGTGEVHALSVPTGGHGVLLAFASAADRLLIGRSHSSASLLCRSDGQRIRGLDFPANLDSFALSEDGERIAFAGDYSDIFLLDARDGKELGRTAKRGHEAALAFVDRGRLIAASGHHAIGFLDTSTGRAIEEPEAHDDEVSAIAVSPDGSLLATAGGFDKTVRLWSTSDGSHVRTLRGHSNGLLALAFSPLGDVIVSSARDGRLIAFEVEDGGARFAVSNDGGEDLTAVAWTADGGAIATIGADGKVVLRDPRDGRVVRELISHAGKDIFVAPVLAISKTGAWIASVGVQGDLAVHDVATGVRIHSADAAKPPALSFSPDAPWLAYRRDSDVIVVELPGGRQVRAHSFGNPSQIALGPDGMLACVQFAQGVELLDVTRGEIRCSWGAEYGIPTQVAFGPDGRLAVGYADGSAALLAVPERVLNADEKRAQALDKRRAGVRPFIRQLADRRVTSGYRDAPSGGDLDADGCGVRVRRDGVDVHVRVAPCDEGYELELRAESLPSPAELQAASSSRPRSLMGRLKGWLKSLNGPEVAPAEPADFAWADDTFGRAVDSAIQMRWEARSLIVAYRLDRLPSPQDFEPWIDACAKRAGERGR